MYPLNKGKFAHDVTLYAHSPVRSTTAMPMATNSVDSFGDLYDLRGG